MATCCGLSLDHLQANVHIKVQSVRTLYCGIQNCLQGVGEKILEEYMVLNMKTGNGEVGRIEN